jgi:hypothetical protein
MRLMTPTRTVANEVGSPSPVQLLLAALLCLFVELVLNVASTLRMSFRRPVAIGTRPTPDALPREKTDSQQQGSNTVAASDHDDDRKIIIVPGSGSLIRVPREGRDPVLLDKNAREALKPRSSKAEQALLSALDPRLRGGYGRGIAPSPA